MSITLHSRSRPKPCDRITLDTTVSEERLLALLTATFQPSQVQVELSSLWQ